MNIIARMDAWEDRHPVLAGMIKLACVAAGLWLTLFGAYVINLAWPL